MRASHTALACLGLLLAGLPAAVRADADEAFRKGIQAADRGRWQEAAKRMREAIAEDSQESDRRILISGVFMRPYLPQFYLGQALFHLGQDHCEDALEAWNSSKTQGAIQKSKLQLQELEEGLRTCNNLLLPPLIAAATMAIERAAALDRGLPDPLPDSSLNGDLAGARKDLAKARRRFEIGSASARLSDLREAEARARTAGQTFAEIEDRAEQAQQQLANAVAAARRAITEAERAENDLADQLSKPQNAAAWRQSGGPRRTDELRARLRTARERLTDAEDFPAVAAVQADAEATLIGYRQAQERLAAFLADSPSPRAQAATRSDSPPATAPTTSPTTTPPPSLPPPATVRPEPTQGESGGEPVSEDAFRRLTTASERLLAHLDTDSGSELLEIQRSRLTLLLREAREPSARETSLLRQRMESSLEALRLLAGAQAYLKGEAEEAVRILDNHEVRPGRLAAQTHLFLAASRFALFHQRGIGEMLLLQQATDSVQKAAHGSDVGLALDPRVFSPTFRKFFDGAVRNLRRNP